MQAVNNVDDIAVESQAASVCRAGKYLAFRLSNEEYGLEILKVREIIGLMGITKVPRTPHHIRGVINLRGKVIPVLDLRLKFGMETIEDTQETCIIVVDIAHSGGTLQMGILVDAVLEVLNIQENEIEETPSFGHDVNTDFILGIGKIKNEVKILLDIDKILTSDDISAASSAHGQPLTDGLEAEREETADAGA